MSRESVLKAFGKLHRNSNGRQGLQQKAPHKPLLILLALSRWKRGERVLIYAEVSGTSSKPGDLRRLITKYGFDGSKSLKPWDPFWSLANDFDEEEKALWRVETPAGNSVQVEKRKRVSDRTLRDAGARGRFSDCVAADLRASPDLVDELFRYILAEYFKPEIHSALLEQLERE